MCIRDSTWLIIITSTAAYQKIASTDIRIGFFAAANDLSAKLSAGSLSPEKAKIAPQLIFNLQFDAWLTVFFISLLWLIVFDMLRVAIRSINGKLVLPLSESPHSPSRLVEDWVRD